MKEPSGYLVIAAILAVLVFFSLHAHAQGRQATLTEAEFTQRFISTATSSVPGITITASKPLKLTVRDSQGGIGSPDLGNAYLLYKSTPSQLDQIIAKQVELLRQLVAPGQNSNSSDQIFPVIKGAEFMAAAARQLAELRSKSNAPDMGGVVQSKLADGLFVTYVYDKPDSVAFITENDARDLKMSEADLRRIGLQNLKRQLEPQLKLEQEGSLYLLALDGNYEASMILLAGDLGRRIAGRVKGDLVAFVLARDTVLVTGSNESQALARAKQFAAKAPAMPYYISNEAYIFRGGAWVLYKP